MQTENQTHVSGTIASEKNVLVSSCLGLMQVGSQKYLQLIIESESDCVERFDVLIPVSEKVANDIQHKGNFSIMIQEQIDFLRCLARKDMVLVEPIKIPTK